MLDAAASSVPVTHNLANHLAKLGCDVHVFTAPHWLRELSGKHTNLYQTKITFYRHTQFRSYEARHRVARQFWKWIRLIQHVAAMFALCLQAPGFDLVHTQIFPVPLLDWAFLRVISWHTPVVCTVHELIPHECRWRRINGLALRSLYRLASVVFVSTEYTRNRLIHELGICGRKIISVRHGELEHLLEFRGAATDQQDVPKILFIGAIRRDKGLDMLIRAAGHLRQRIAAFKLQIAGTPGFDMTSIRNLITELGLGDVVQMQLGYIPEEQFAAYVAEATVIALPYRRIEQSGVAIAACTFGKAIVATRCGGVEELVGAAGNGLLVPIDDSAAFGEALEIVLTDNQKRKAFENRSRMYARQALAWEPIAVRTVAAYRKALTEFH